MGGQTESPTNGWVGGQGVGYPLGYVDSGVQRVPHVDDFQSGERSQTMSRLQLAMPPPTRRRQGNETECSGLNWTAL